MNAGMRTALGWSRGSADARICHSDLALDLNSRTVWRGVREIRLSKRELALVAAFLRQPGHIFTRDELLALVWSDDCSVKRGTVETYISYLRTKIDAPPAQPLIHTVRGVGYLICHIGSKPGDRHDNGPMVGDERR